MNKTQLSFAEGWTVFFQARTVFVVLMIIAMVINLGIFGTARFAKKLILYPQDPTATRPAVQVQPVPDQAATTRSDKWKTAFSGLMTFTTVLAIVSAIFLVFCALVGIMMIIAGQFPGAGMATGAFFWAAGMVALLLPWSAMLPQASGLPVGVPSFGNISNDIFQSRLSNATLWMEILLWLKFALYPVIILLMSLMYYKRTNQANSQLLSDQTAGIGQ